MSRRTIRTGPTSLLLATATIATLAFAAACEKSESPAPAPSASVSAAAPLASTAAPASATAPASADTATTAAKDAADAGRAAVDAKKTDASTASTAAGSASAAPAECGTKPLPDCPLQAWMKSNANPPVMTNDTAALATALDKIIAFAPPGYTNWASISKDGAAAARGGDITAAKAACRTCHDQYKQKYKTEMRARKL